MRARDSSAGSARTPASSDPGQVLRLLRRRRHCPVADETSWALGDASGRIGMEARVMGDAAAAAALEADEAPDDLLVSELA